VNGPYPGEGKKKAHSSSKKKKVNSVSIITLPRGGESINMLKIPSREFSYEGEGGNVGEEAIH